MKVLTLDLAKQTGWAAMSEGGKITSGHVTFTEETFPELALAFWSWLNARLVEVEPDYVAYLSLIHI